LKLEISEKETEKDEM